MNQIQNNFEKEHGLVELPEVDFNIADDSLLFTILGKIDYNLAILEEFAHIYSSNRKDILLTLSKRNNPEENKNEQ